MTLIRPDAPIDPWRIELIVVKGAARTGAERGAISRDVTRGLLHRLRPGVYVERVAYEALGPEQAHLVRMRAIAATSPDPVVFSHWSAAVLLGLPALRTRLGRVHVTVDSPDERRGRDVADHVFSIAEQEVVQSHGLSATGTGRTVVDIAASARLEEGVIAADAVLRSRVPRAVLQAAVDLAGDRRASIRMRRTVAFAHPGAESPAESRTRVTAYRIGVEVPDLQRPLVLDDGRRVFLDQYYRDADAVLEIDGDVKYRDPEMTRSGAADAVIAEKRREDEVRTRVRALGRIGWLQSGDVSLLRPALTRIGVRPLSPRPDFTDWCSAASSASPRSFS